MSAIDVLSLIRLAQAFEAVTSLEGGAGERRDTGQLDIIYTAPLHGPVQLFVLLWPHVDAKLGSSRNAARVYPG
jgi:hypothetical protein